MDFVLENKGFFSEINGEWIDNFYLTFPEIISESDYRFIKFKEKPLVINWFLEENGEVMVEFDFGMTHKICVDYERNFILKHAKDKPIADRIFQDIKFDLFHAFFHYQEDPNYSTYHWAIYGNLKDRIETSELEELLESEEENNE